jgi:UDP-N-acetylmuramate--alanine ligase
MQSLKGKSIHFIGIGGAGMSGLARIALADGISVSGSDSKDSTVLSALEAIGAKIYRSHKAEHITGADVVIYSTAISTKNPELSTALERSIPVLTRAKALALLMSGSMSIAVAGTHGKTTTSSMMTVALQTCGEDPSFAIGGTLTTSGSNAHRGSGKFFVAEADESDGSFIEYHPSAAIVTNIEHDHVDFFKSEADVTRVFSEFAATIQAGGRLVYCLDDKGARALGESVKGAQAISYGEGEGAELRITDIELSSGSSRAKAFWHGKSVGTIELQVPGKHNLLNAASCLAMGLSLGLPVASLLTGLHSFRGTGRRFELKATIHGIRIIDDYGHHPTEIAVTLEAARRYVGDGNLIVIFQPHRYSRTQAFLDNFARELDRADDVTVLEVYAASEKPIAGISGRLIVEKMQRGHFVPNFAEAADRVVSLAKPGDVIMTLGAGDVSSLATVIAEGLEKRFEA